MLSWTEAMDAAKAFCAEHCIEWWELRHAVVSARVAECPELYAEDGIGSSDANHMIYAAVTLGELPTTCADLVQRGELLRRVASDRDPRQVLAELREFFAPVPA